MNSPFQPVNLLFQRCQQFSKSFNPECSQFALNSFTKMKSLPNYSTPSPAMNSSFALAATINFNYQLAPTPRQLQTATKHAFAATRTHSKCSTTETSSSSNSRKSAQAI